MTVKELIEALEQYDDDLIVVYPYFVHNGYYSGHYETEEVDLLTVNNRDGELELQ